MSKLNLTYAAVTARRSGGEDPMDTTPPKWERYMKDPIRSITVKIDIELDSNGDFSKYWNNLDALKQEVFLKIFGPLINEDGKLEIEIP